MVGYRGWLVILHLKTQRNLVASEVQRWIVKEVWVHPAGFRSSAIWTSDTNVMGSKRSQPHCPKKKESSSIRPTYVQTLHILSMNIVVLTLVTNPAYHQTLTFSN
jgi:hypothetical protein